MKHIPQPNLNAEFMDLFKSLNILSSIEDDDRLFRAHGQTLHEIFVLRQSTFKRIPDLVVWPKNTQQVIDIVNLAVKCNGNVVIIPFGGGTSVSGKLQNRLMLTLTSQRCLLCITCLKIINRLNFSRSVRMSRI